MSEDNKRKRYCIPCDTRGDHTSLDHRQCPEKRKIVQERVREAREKRITAETEIHRDTNLIKQTIEISNSNAWPALQQNKDQQQKASTIVLLALLDEAHREGTFQQNFTKALNDNGLPNIQYTPEKGTATYMARMIAGSNFLIPQTPKLPKSLAHTSNSHRATTIDSDGHSSTSDQVTDHSVRTKKTTSHLKFLNDVAKRHRSPTDNMGSTETPSTTFRSIDQMHKKSKNEKQNVAETEPNTIIISQMQPNEPVSSIRQLKEELKKAPLKLSQQYVNNCCIGKTGIHKECITIDELNRMLKKGHIVLQEHERTELISKTEFINSKQGGDLELSIICDYSDF